MLVFAVPFATGISVLSRSIILLIYGPNYAGAAGVLSIAIWSQVFMFVGLVNDYLLITAGKQRLAAILTGTTAFVNLTLNYVLTSHFGIRGAALAVVISSAVFLPLQIAIPTVRP